MFYTLCIFYINLESSIQNNETDVAGIATNLGAKKSSKKRNGKISKRKEKFIEDKLLRTPVNKLGSLIDGEYSKEPGKMKPNALTQDEKEAILVKVGEYMMKSSTKKPMRFGTF